MIATPKTTKTRPEYCLDAYQRVALWTLGYAIDSNPAAAANGPILPRSRGSPCVNSGREERWREGMRRSVENFMYGRNPVLDMVIANEEAAIAGGERARRVETCLAV